jgi:hypothetical protein
MLKAFTGILWKINLSIEKYVIFYLKYEKNIAFIQNVLCILLANEHVLCVDSSGHK